MFRYSAAGLLITFLAAFSFAEERMALVVGNGKYEGEAALKNPTNDAAAIAAALGKLDFKVTTKTDVNLNQLEDAVVAFSRSLKRGSVAVFFYAGHGLQVKGDNFLVPLDARIREEFQVKDKCYKVEQVLAAMEESQAGLKVIILDCCRDNPFTRGWTRGVGNKGLASIASIPDGTIIAFSTAPGKTALDGRGANSPYSKHLAAALESRPVEGLELKETLFAASRAVKLEVGQAPWINLEASLDKYYLRRGEPSGKAPMKTAPIVTASTPRETQLATPTPAKPIPAKPTPQQSPPTFDNGFNFESATEKGLPLPDEARLFFPQDNASQFSPVPAETKYRVDDFRIRGGELSRLEKNGAAAWRIKVPDSKGYLTEVEQSKLFVAGTDFVMCLDPAIGKILWSKTILGLKPKYLFFAAAGVVDVGDQSGTSYKFYLQTGERVFEAPPSVRPEQSFNSGF